MLFAFVYGLAGCALSDVTVQQLQHQQNQYTTARAYCPSLPAKHNSWTVYNIDNNMNPLVGQALANTNHEFKTHFPKELFAWSEGIHLDITTDSNAVANMWSMRWVSDYQQEHYPLLGDVVQQTPDTATFLLSWQLAQPNPARAIYRIYQRLPRTRYRWATGWQVVRNAPNGKPAQIEFYYLPRTKRIHNLYKLYRTMQRAHLIQPPHSFNKKQRAPFYQTFHYTDSSTAVYTIYNSDTISYHLYNIDNQLVKTFKKTTKTCNCTQNAYTSYQYNQANRLHSTETIYKAACPNATNCPLQATHSSFLYLRSAVDTTRWEARLERQISTQQDTSYILLR